MKYIGKLIRFSFLILLLSMANSANATSFITMTNGYVKASIPGTEVTAAYMTLSNASEQTVTLLKVESPISDRIEIHQHTMVNGMMRMREVTEIALKAGDEVTLKPMGLHLMIFALKQPITTQQTIPLTLYFSNKTKLDIQLPVSR